MSVLNLFCEIKIKSFGSYEDDIRDQFYVETINGEKIFLAFLKKERSRLAHDGYAFDLETGRFRLTLEEGAACAFTFSANEEGSQYQCDQDFMNVGNNPLEQILYILKYNTQSAAVTIDEMDYMEL